MFIFHRTCVFNALLFAALAVFGVQLANAAIVTVRWDLPVTRENGSSLAIEELASTTVTYTNPAGASTTVVVDAPLNFVRVEIPDCTPIVFSAYVTDTKGSKSASARPIEVEVCRPTAPEFTGFTIE